MDWQPIETAPKDGTSVLCWAPGWEEPSLLIWKANPRLLTPVEGHSSSYFGDAWEMDDYELARPENFPTHWLDYRPLPALPA